MRLYKAFILPHCYYCSTVWHFCNTRDSEKLEKLNKRILKFIFKDEDSDYNQLLKKAGITNLRNRRLQYMVLILFKCLYLNNNPSYLKQMISLRFSSYSFNL